MVPLDPDRVRAAFGISGLSATDVARRVGESQQTVDLIKRGKTKRCRKARRDKLEAVLNVPEGWLGNEAEYGSTLLETAMTQHPEELSDHSHALRWWQLAHKIAAAETHGTRGFLETNEAYVVYDTLPHLVVLQSALRWRWALMDTFEIPGEEEHDDLLLADQYLSKAFEIILQPWFANKATLDTNSLDRISAAHNAGVDDAIKNAHPTRRKK